jgi:hypothetical protein
LAASAGVSDLAGIGPHVRCLGNVPGRGGLASSRNEERSDRPGDIAGGLGRVGLEVLFATLPQSAHQALITLRVGDPALRLGEIRKVAQPLDGLDPGFETRDVRARIGRPLERVFQGLHVVRELHKPLGRVNEGFPGPFLKADIVGGRLPCDAAMLAQPSAALVDRVLNVLLSFIEPRAGIHICSIVAADCRCDVMGTRLGILDRGAPEMLAIVYGVLANAFEEPAYAAENPPMTVPPVTRRRQKEESKIHGFDCVVYEAVRT